MRFDGFEPSKHPIRPAKHHSNQHLSRETSHCHSTEHQQTRFVITRRLESKLELPKIKFNQSKHTKTHQNSGCQNTPTKTKKKLSLTHQTPRDIPPQQMRGVRLTTHLEALSDLRGLDEGAGGRLLFLGEVYIVVLRVCCSVLQCFAVFYTVFGVVIAT